MIKCVLNINERVNTIPLYVSSFTNFAFMRKRPSFTNFAFMRIPHCVHALILQWRYFIAYMVEYRQPEWSVAWTQCSFAFLICVMCACASLWPVCILGATSGVFHKKKSVSGGSFIGWKSVKEEIYLFVSKTRHISFSPTNCGYFILILGFKGSKQGLAKSIF